LDWVEGAALVQTNRVLLGQKIYVEPSAAYIPLIYQPLYFYIAAAFTKLLGFSLAPSRLLSILASCGCILMIFFITRKATGFSFPGVISAGLFAATNGVVWTWFDFAKVDMLYVFFSLLGLFFLMQADIRSAILAGIFFTLSFFTKQSALIIILPAFIFYFLVNRRLSLLFMVTIGLLTSAGILLLNFDSNGWYFFYVYTLPTFHRLDTNPVQIDYVVTSILEPILLFIGVVFISIIIDLKKFIRDDRHYYFFFGLASFTLPLSIIGALSIGSTRNAFIPAYALIAIVCGIGIQFSQEKIAALISGNVRFIGSILLIAICLMQFSLLQYKARPYVPSTQDFKRAYVLIKDIQDTDGEFLIPSQNYLALVVHKKVYYHDAPLGEFSGWYGQSLPEGARIAQEIRGIVQSGEISVIYMTEPFHDWLGMRCEKEATLQSKSKFVPTLYKMRCH
jgi:4-amino-4-deoxy-L-arabinose transferase-like glycosyltransferase